MPKIKTLFQYLDEDDKRTVETADSQLEEHLRDGWTVLGMSVTTQWDYETQSGWHDRVVTLQKIEQRQGKQLRHKKASELTHDVDINALDAIRCEKPEQYHWLQIIADHKELRVNHSDNRFGIFLALLGDGWIVSDSYGGDTGCEWTVFKLSEKAIKALRQNGLPE